jgi:hypothetical protein
MNKWLKYAPNLFGSNKEVRYDVEIPFNLPKLDAYPVELLESSPFVFNIVAPIKGTIQRDEENNAYIFIPDEDTPLELIEQHKRLLEAYWNDNPASK